MLQPGEAGPLDEAIAYRLILLGLHEDDPMESAAMDDMFDGGTALNLMLSHGSRDVVTATITQPVSEKTLEAEAHDR